MQNLNAFDIDPDEFRALAHHTVDWIADYLRDIRHYPVASKIEPGALIHALPESAPELPESMHKILADFESQIIPAITHWNHPRFHAYFSVSASAPGILAEMLTAALNVNGMLWKSCPAATELEQVTLDWLRQWIGLPPADHWFGIIYDTASISTMHAIAAAREQSDPTTRLEGGSKKPHRLFQRASPLIRRKERHLHWDRSAEHAQNRPRPAVSYAARSSGRSH